jgi:hypothetical protein
MKASLCGEKKSHQDFSEAKPETAGWRKKARGFAISIAAEKKPLRGGTAVPIAFFDTPQRRVQSRRGERSVNQK